MRKFIFGIVIYQKERGSSTGRACADVIAS